MFDVLMYLFETYIHNHSEFEITVDQDTLTADLKDVGFHQEDIFKALNWLEELAKLQDNETVPYLANAGPNALRLYTDMEMARLDADCRGFLLFLEQIHVLDPDTREMVIDRVMELDSEHFDLDDLKWVVMMVLFNVPGCEQAYQQMEDLLFETTEGYIH